MITSNKISGWIIFEYLRQPNNVDVISFTWLHFSWRSLFKMYSFGQWGTTWIKLYTWNQTVQTHFHWWLCQTTVEVTTYMFMTYYNMMTKISKLHDNKFYKTIIKHFITWTQEISDYTSLFIEIYVTELHKTFQGDPMINARWS